MATITVPLNDDLIRAIQALIDSGVAANKADAIRKALQKFIEEKEVEDILHASKEPRLEGDLDNLASKLS